ncbi:iron donor protein CyaY [Cladophialophora bantiana CBS 173.52]|uniref:ferroxidase n=1 Tax=Cladophialophora bantiana (strain ATCC 10958 / CBS 173.52 / CDC B-1940 / NIH 8579) TaxID=1442370 RepID=A0A0D2ERS2_CLAB1|nr:iron donor protein CyaY [Cladophialophora bantiana CBS 173.52]KIW92586.1 iron donor protein CyaY [Cladophialophora bantiana CBS 173.52]
MKATGRILRATRPSILLRRQRPSPAQRVAIPASTPLFPIFRQGAPFSTAFTRSLKGLQPDSSNPDPPNTEPSQSNSSGAAQISDPEYHEIADQYLNTLVLAMEELAERSSEGVEAEFSAGVLTITHPKHGTYVINKQPPNKQIWLSSPISGPKRYDWVVSGDSQHEKADSTVDLGDDGQSGGRWIYLRDRSSLSDLLRKELGVEITHGGDGEGDDTEGRVNSAP